MHSVSHSLSHRAQPARRSVRWQPYNSIVTPHSDKPTSSPRHPVIPTKALLPSTPSTSSTPLCETDRLRQALPNPKEQTLRASSTKTKHAISLVDQAAKSLCEIWHPYDIPAAFLSSSGAAVTIGGAPDALPRPAIGGSSITTRRSPTIQSSAQSSSTVKTSPVTQTDRKSVV